MPTVMPIAGPARRPAPTLPLPSSPTRVGDHTPLLSAPIGRVGGAAGARPSMPAPTDVTAVPGDAYVRAETDRIALAAASARATAESKPVLTFWQKLQNYGTFSTIAAAAITLTIFALAGHVLGVAAATVLGVSLGALGAIVLLSIAASFIMRRAQVDQAQTHAVRDLRGQVAVIEEQGKALVVQTGRYMDENATHQRANAEQERINVELRQRGEQLAAQVDRLEVDLNRLDEEIIVAQERNSDEWREADAAGDKLREQLELVVEYTNTLGTLNGQLGIAIGEASRARRDGVADLEALRPRLAALDAKLAEVRERARALDPEGVHSWLQAMFIERFTRSAARGSAATTTGGGAAHTMHA